MHRSFSMEHLLWFPQVDWSPNFFKQVSNSRYIHGADKFSSKDSTQYLDMVSTLSKEYT